MSEKWWEDQDNVVALARFLADDGADADTVAYMVEKPWKYGDEYRTMMRGKV